MKIIKSLVMFGTMILLAVTPGCGGSGGGDGGGSSTGTITMSITDAKPVLPQIPGEEINNVFVTIDEVRVHRSGGGWGEPLALPKTPTPYRIDLLEFSGDNTTELVPPVTIEAGKYTQVRLSVVSAALTFKSNPSVEIPITIPSENLKTDQNFDFDVAGSEAVDITVDFDLSKSLVLEGAEYKLKPVLHIVATDDAATIEGTIDNGNFVDTGDPKVTPYVVITVFDSNGQEYTSLQVDIDSDSTPGDSKTSYAIFWLVPNQAYQVGINYNPASDNVPDEYADVPSLKPGDTYTLDFPLPP
jgi:hypothetical protein